MRSFIRFNGSSRARPAIGREDTAQQVNEVVHAVNCVSIYYDSWWLGTGTEILQFRFWPRNPKAECTGSLTEAVQAGDSFSCRLDEKKPYRRRIRGRRNNHPHC